MGKKSSANLPKWVVRKNSRDSRQVDAHTSEAGASDFKKLLGPHKAYVCLTEARTRLVQSEEVEGNDYVWVDPKDHALKTREGDFITADAELNIVISTEAKEALHATPFSQEGQFLVRLGASGPQLSAHTNGTMRTSKNEKAWEFFTLV